MDIFWTKNRQPILAKILSAVRPSKSAVCRFIGSVGNTAFGGFSFRQFVYLFGERISYLRESVLSVLLGWIADTRKSHVITYLRVFADSLLFAQTHADPRYFVNNNKRFAWTTDIAWTCGV